MGNWRITIEGTGPHHGSNPAQHPDDAEKVAPELVRLMASHGHIITRAEFELLIPDPRVQGINREEARRLTDKGVGERQQRFTAPPPGRQG